MSFVNQFEGLWAAPLNHPITCLNPAPWKIIETRVERTHEGPKVWIRGAESCWFNADQCYCDSYNDVSDYVAMMKSQEAKKEKEIEKAKVLDPENLLEEIKLLKEDILSLNNRITMLEVLKHHHQT